MVDKSLNFGETQFPPSQNAKVFITVLWRTSHLTLVRLSFYLHKMEIIPRISQSYILTTLSKMTSPLGLPLLSLSPSRINIQKNFNDISILLFPLYLIFLNCSTSFYFLSLYCIYSLFTVLVVSRLQVSGG